MFKLWPQADEGENITRQAWPAKSAKASQGAAFFIIRLHGKFKIITLNKGITINAWDISLFPLYIGLRRIDQDILDRDPLLVIVEFGGNDFLRKVPKETTIVNMHQMVERILAKGAMVAIVDISAGMVLNEYSADFRKIAHEKGAIFVPKTFSGIITNPNLKSDFIHPNRAGYALIAQRVYQAIKPYLKQNHPQNY